MAALSAGQTATLIWIVGTVVRFILSVEFIGQPVANLVSCQTVQGQAER